MKSSERILINTIAQYTRTIINMLLSLYTVRIVLSSLGQSDFGIYTLIAGVIAMLGFITNSLIATTQRFISFSQGQGDLNETKNVFNNSLIIHLFLGFIIALFLETISPWIFDGFLNIPECRIQASVTVYHIVAIILFTTFITSPFKALLVSHENIVYISLVEILDAVIRVILVIIMSYSNYDKLIFYAFIMLGIQIVNCIALSLYCFLRYDECIFPNIRLLKKESIIELLSFAGWRIYGTVCTVGRQQGISVLLNNFYGTILNAGWGIGSQLSGYTNFLASAIVNAMAPQIVKAEGAGEREKAIWLSNILSKLVFFLMSIIGIPCIFEINKVLEIWLGTPPEKASLFSIMFIMALLVDSMTIGLTHINTAIGKIRKYIIVMSTPKLFTLVFVFLVFKYELPIYYACIAFIVIELFCSFIRIPLIKEHIELNMTLFFKDVIFKEITPLIICILTCIISTNLIDSEYRFIITFVFSGIIYTISMYYIGLCCKERVVVNQLFSKFKSKIKKNG